MRSKLSVCLAALEDLEAGLSLNPGDIGDAKSALLELVEASSGLSKLSSLSASEIGKLEELLNSSDNTASMDLQAYFLELSGIAIEAQHIQLNHEKRAFTLVLPEEILRQDKLQPKLIPIALLLGEIGWGFRLRVL